MSVSDIEKDSLNLQCGEWVPVHGSVMEPNREFIVGSMTTKSRDSNISAQSVETQRTYPAIGICLRVKFALGP
jgi:hypothetical protein